MRFAEERKIHNKVEAAAECSTQSKRREVRVRLTELEIQDQSRNSISNKQVLVGALYRLCSVSKYFIALCRDSIFADAMHLALHAPVSSGLNSEPVDTHIRCV